MEILANPVCTECGSSKTVKDGIRYLADGSQAQRWLCRTCFYRFIPEDNKRRITHYHSRECAELKDPKNSLGAEMLLDQKNGEMSIGLAGATENSKDFLEHLKRDNYSESTIKACKYYLSTMERKHIDVLKPEQVKGFIAEQKWNNHSKATACIYYDIFARAMHLAWDPPRYRYEQKIPWVPLESEVDALISGSGHRMSVFLRLLKETGMRCGEALRLTWKDLDLERSLVFVNKPEKGSLPRQLLISNTLKAMLNSMPGRCERIFSGSMSSYQSNFRRQRNKQALKLQNPRLNQISFHSFRHFYATMRYAKIQNLVKVQQELGHKNINNTQIYTHLIDFKSEEYDVQIAETTEEAKKLGEAGFEHYDTVGNQHLYRKRK